MAASVVFPKKGMMKKRGQGLSTFGVKNWKERWFELTEKELSYWDKFGGAKDGANKKGSILIASVVLVEDVAREAFQREFVFQVGYCDDAGVVYHLYIQAADARNRADWVAHLRHAAAQTTKLKSPRYHPSVYADKVWLCCKARVKTNAGCKNSYFGRLAEEGAAAASAAAAAAPAASSSTSSRSGSAHSAGAGPATGKHRGTNGSTGSGAPAARTQYKTVLKDPLPPVPGGGGGGGSAAVAGQEDALPALPAAPALRKVVVNFEYAPTQAGDLAVRPGEVLDVLEDGEPNWWKARRADGTVGFVPSNYVSPHVEKQGIDSEPWFHGKMGRSEAAAMLRMAAFSGAYLVRESESKPGEYSLSVSFESQLKHYHIKAEKGEFWVNHRHKFDSIGALIEYHKHNSGGLITRLRKTVTEAKAPPTAGFGHNQWEISKDDIKVGQMLGEGNWGYVHLGEYKKNGQLIAVKTLKQQGSVELQDDFIAEAKVMMQCSHPNLVQLYGVSSTPPMFIITEFMRHGCLLDFLRENQQLGDDPDVLNGMGVDVAAGMSYLEAKQFIHRDLAARNCLVGENTVVKVADFGLARFVFDDEYTASEGTKYPVKWAAPEVINYNRFSTKSDVWSFGIILWEIWSLGKKPYPGMNNVDVIEEVTNRHYRLSRPELATHDMHDVMLDCWHEDPDNRPTFVDLHDRLAKGVGAYAAEDDLVEAMSP